MEFLEAMSSQVVPNLSSLIVPEVSAQENQVIMQPPSIEEVKEVMFSIPIDSSLGPDGFG